MQCSILIHNLFFFSFVKIVTVMDLRNLKSKIGKNLNDVVNALWLFQKILLIQNPEPYLTQIAGSNSAVVMRNATLSWTKRSQSESPPRAANEVTEHNMDVTSPNENVETLPTLRNISFTLPKVWSNNNNWSYQDSAGCEMMISVIFPEGKTAWCLWECG